MVKGQREIVTKGKGQTFLTVLMRVEGYICFTKPSFIGNVFRVSWTWLIFLVDGGHFLHVTKVGYFE